MVAVIGGFVPSRLHVPLLRQRCTAQALHGKARRCKHRHQDLEEVDYGPELTCRWRLVSLTEPLHSSGLRGPDKLLRATHASLSPGKLPR